MRPLNLVFVLLLMAFSGIAQAQSNEKQLGEANRTAMDAYNNLEIEVAKETLQRAIANAERHGLTGPGLARTYANLGVVEIGGFSDAAAALDAFVKALREDPNVEPDPLVSTPEVLQVFAQAKRRAGQGGGSRSRSRTPPPPAMVEGNLEHVPAAEQLVNAPVPVYVANSDPEVASMKIFYRSIGMKQPKSSLMTQTSDGFTYMIPCEDVFAPKVEYFVLAFDAEGNRIGNAGTPENPVTVPIVSRRSQPAPSLPGQVPPSQCGGGEEEPFAAEEEDSSYGYSECTPGMPGCGREGALGDSCHDDMDCGEGLTCLDNFCAFGSREGKKRDNGDAPRFYFDFGVGLGAAVVSNGMRADSAPPRALLENVDRRLDMSATRSPEAAKQLVAEEGWDCAVSETLNGDRVFYTYSDCKVKVGSSGLVAMPVLSATLGYYVTPRIGVAAVARYQIGHGQGTIGLSGGLRGDFLLTQPSATGLYAGFLAGVLVGPIQARPPSPKKDGAITEGPYATSGPFGVQAGLRLGYRFTRNFGLQLTPVVNLMLGDFMFAVDATAGVTLSF